MGSSIEIGPTASEIDRVWRKEAAAYPACSKHTKIKLCNKVGPSIRRNQYRRGNTKKENGNTKATARLQDGNAGELSLAQARNVPGRQSVALMAPATASASRKS